MPGKRSRSGVDDLPAVRQITTTLGKLGIPVPESFARQVQDYVRLLLFWNQKISLTTITDPRQILIRHFGESLFGARAAGIKSGQLLDVGSGAGFPALPIAMLFPEISEILLEPNLKKAAFLSEACRVLKLSERVKILKARLETYKGDDAHFDFVTSRAVRVTLSFLERCVCLLKSDGKLVLWLGQEDLELLAKSPGWIWHEAAKMPDSERSFAVWGKPLGRDVPRGTPGANRST